MLVGQQLTVNLELKPSAVAETVTVSGEAPLVNVTTSQLGGNIDSRQMQELPVNGRNFLDLTLLAPGNRANHTEPGGLPVTTALGTVQLNVDGMQVTNNCCGGATGSQASAATPSRSSSSSPTASTPRRAAPPARR